MSYLERLLSGASGVQHNLIYHCGVLLMSGAVGSYRGASVWKGVLLVLCVRKLSVHWSLLSAKSHGLTQKALRILLRLFRIIIIISRWSTMACCWRTRSMWRTACWGSMLLPWYEANNWYSGTGRACFYLKSVSRAYEQRQRTWIQRNESYLDRYYRSYSGINSSMNVILEREENGINRRWVGSECR